VCVLSACQGRGGDALNINDVPVAELELPVSLRVPGELIYSCEMTLITDDTKRRYGCKYAADGAQCQACQERFL